MVQAGNAGRVGHVASEAKFSEFGLYQQRLIEAIAARWNQLCRYASISALDSGTSVVLEFSINSQGHLSGIDVVSSTLSQAGVQRCKAAILYTSPFKSWTSAMRNRLGSSYKMRLKFIHR